MKKDIIWITGAKSGIGKALADKFSSKELNVVGTSRTIKPDNSSSNFLILEKNDISNSSDIKEFVNSIQEQYNIDCLINNAGITSFKPFIENNLDEIDSIIDTNLKGAVYAIKAILPQMIERRSGTIINILSVAAVKIFENSSVYAASKAGLEAFSKVIREELREHNIRVINIFPGATATEIWPDSAIEQYSSKMMTPENLADLIIDVYKNSSVLSPEEIVVRPISGDL